ncbi:MAG TPA: hypothetical protein PKE47_11785, partial [Verrucomicrobiota bacterium]|nr:hypothetical protein [Verrucomicrobiota bacterium]
MTVDTFKAEIAEAVRQYDRFVVCLDKPTDDFARSLRSLVQKAITAFETRAAGLRHGIALDRHVTVILSESGAGRPHRGVLGSLPPGIARHQASVSPYCAETRDLGGAAAG